MKAMGSLLKMKTKLQETVSYQLPVGGDFLALNELLGKKISICYENQIICIACGKPTQKSFAQGFCYSCFLSSPETSDCILRPELCQAHEGRGRDTEWEKQHHLQEHFVYLAYSTEIKVGVTRSTQVPVRWIDQGASAVICLAKTPYRQLAGLIEVEMKKHFTDKTSWQKMLTSPFNLVLTDNETEGLKQQMLSAKRKAKNFLPGQLADYYSEDYTITQIHYPVFEQPQKVKSIDLEKTPLVRGKLTGIKGQYLIFENGSVFNVRKHSGYVVSIEY